ncbi:hypothetical protein [Mycetocola zhadangensis]|uniref:Uncharacterized protein n=1 Tax=Mycetocola zhadangensis TaxID=1164595 RepID=A0A3L7J584_9MICO|nr:hypothetical protein [Mycetocola zhadangensis]RLQ85660.1 hypothetical protein D9V28_01940 [Mycetocola zhadangensis]GGE84559.1 hypothetical protein GCM10011313_03830 [Mycetocola zhadangensis]
MKRWIIGVASILVLSIFALLAVKTYADIGRGLGVQFGPMDSPEAALPVAVGFGSMYLIGISAVVLVALIGVTIVRAYFPRGDGRR